MSTTDATGFRTAYDSEFTADINKKMQMPDRLVAVSGFSENTKHSNVSAPYGDQITSFVGKSFIPLADSVNYKEPHFILDTPPNSLKSYAGTTLVDDDDDFNEDIRRAWIRNKMKSNKPETPKKNGQIEEIESEADFPMPITPGTMLLMRNGDTVLAMQRQIGKLARHVAQLQDDERKRRNREIILYPLVFGYIIIQLGRFILARVG